MSEVTDAVIASMDEDLLLEKWWWRALKVFYILVCFACFSLVISSAYSERPRKIQSYSEINVNCNDKKENSFHFSPSDSFFATLDDLKWSKSDEDFATKSCEYGLNRRDYAQLESVARNYTVSLRFDSQGSWESVAGTLLVGFLVTFGVIETIKTIILYILGISVWRGLLLYGLLFMVAIFQGNKKESEDSIND